MTSQFLPGVETGRSVTPRRVLMQAGKNHEIQIPVVLDGTYSYDGDNTSYEKYIRGGAFLAYNSTTGTWAPCKRTRANGAGSSTTTLIVDNATHFRAADSVIVGGNSAQAIVSIDYSTDTITLTSAISWADNDQVYVSAFGTARAILLDDEVSLWNKEKTAYVNKTCQAVIAGFVDQSQVLGDFDSIYLHRESRELLSQIIFDDTQTGLDALPASPLLLEAADVAATGTNQATGAALTTGAVLNVTAADGTKAVVLPPAVSGTVLYVYNSVATNGLPIYPAAGDTINGGSADAAITIEGKTLAILVATSYGNWAATFTANT